MKTEDYRELSENFPADPPDTPTAGRRLAVTVSALLVSKTLGAAADKVGIHEKTLRQWMKDPAMQAALREAETELIESVVSRLAAESGNSLDRLIALRDDPKAPPGVALRAATVLLEFTVRLRNQMEIERRLQTIETMLEERGAAKIR